jgi:tRNA nucleotidyltransferase/poly(A) polymerase
MKNFKLPAFCESIKFLGFDKIIEMKPLLNGNEIAVILDIKPGKQVGLILQKMVEWQILEFPKKLTSEDAISWVKEFSSVFKQQ